jgi:hypothetical protein
MPSDRHRWRALALLVRAGADLEWAGRELHSGRHDDQAHAVLNARALLRDIINGAIADLNFSEAFNQIQVAGELLVPPLTNEEPPT